MTGETILIVEDDFLVRLTLSEALLNEGFTVLEAEDAPAALALMQAHPGVALLMTDLQLGGAMDGRALVARLRAENINIPVLYMTGRPDTVMGLDPAREHLIGKPYLPSEICARVRIILAQSAAARRDIL